MDTQNSERIFDRELIKQNLESAKAEMGKLSDGRSIKLLAVTKTVPVDVINYGIDELGITAIGENRVQELMSKYELLHSPKDGKLEIHLIGSLQTNKVKYIIDKVDMIESVDSEKLAAEIDKQAKKHGITMDILIEINIGREPQKGGILPEDLEAFIEAVGEYKNLRLRGLMTVAPRCTDSEERHVYFRETKKLFDKISDSNLPAVSKECFDTLSMGMSQSYKEAIPEGSTEVRLGSTLFGERIYPETK